MGSLAASGIVKGKPDARMKKILTDAAAIGTAAARTLNWRARPAEGFIFPVAEEEDHIKPGAKVVRTGRWGFRPSSGHRLGTGQADCRI